MCIRDRARVERLCEWIAGYRVAGVGQSSWGPTGFALLSDGATGTQLKREAERRFGTRYENLRFVVIRGRNRGAEIGFVG